MIGRLDLSTARALLDFRAGAADVVSEIVAEEQLTGAVAIHNMLQDQNVAYLADEVGMGKTYVALGAMALMRHFNPHSRVMVIAPKENIQLKWIKEWRNFVSKVVQIEDLRVKGIGGNPARALVKVDSLVDLVTEASNDPDRDFFLRLTSFSLPVSAANDTLRKRRDQLLKAIPWCSSDLLKAHNKTTYKRNFARAVNCALPDIDLLIVDEAHNLKAGWSDAKSSSTRNTVVGCALGGKIIQDEFQASFRGFRPRVGRVLFLSATPIEHDIRQLWNQLDLFGFSRGWEPLRDSSLTHEQHRDIVRRVLIRRTAELKCGKKQLTKSEYRREWRGGGVLRYDDPLEITSDRQRLAVALIQKKVSELLGSGQHSHSFQVGLLASFESFLETVRNRNPLIESTSTDADEDTSEQGTFHRTAEEVAASREHSVEGLDISAINDIARDHRRVFQKEMPHPKMDAIVEELTKSFTTGKKSLVFVRRVASVDELQRKLEDRYDQLLFDRLRASLSTSGLRQEMEVQISAYCDARAMKRHDFRARDAWRSDIGSDGETSSIDSFFAWFFRGEGPPNVRSGASIAEQIDRPTGNYSTFLEDNYVAGLLSARPEEVVAKFAKAVGVSEPKALDRVARLAAQYLGTRPTKLQRRRQFRAFQAAGVAMLAGVEGEVGKKAELLLNEVFGSEVPDVSQTHILDDPTEWLSTPTFFSSLRFRQDLRAAIWPQPADTDRASIREVELRRELLSTMIRKGHPIIDVFILIANRIRTLRQRSRETIERELADEFLEELERQRTSEPGVFNSFYELSETADKFKLIRQLNVPELEQANEAAISRILGKTLRAQRPVAGMAGKVNSELVRQFRMPGYPLILITTDLLKEGEDLHTFCSNVYHYGVAWMPSELEQRVGRIDRVGSQTERRLLAINDVKDEGELLQVYYPHLRDTVEVLQLNRVYERLNRFMKIMHEGLGAPPKEKSSVSVIEEGLRASIDTAVIRTPLKSAFRVTPQMLAGKAKPLAVTEANALRTRSRLDRIEQLLSEMGGQSTRRNEGNQIVVEIKIGDRMQPVTLLLRSLRGTPVLRCVSPVGRIDFGDWDDELAASMVNAPFTRISIETNEKFEAYDVAIEGDVLLGAEEADRSRASFLIREVVQTADDLERAIYSRDARLADVESEMNLEGYVAR
jgi:superfamily II DNA/RNA helicase